MNTIISFKITILLTCVYKFFINCNFELVLVFCLITECTNLVLSIYIFTI